MLQPKKTLTKTIRPISDTEKSKLIRTPKAELTRVTRPATEEETARFGIRKSQDYNGRPKTMATKPMSEVPSAKKEFISKLSSASEKAKSYKSFDGMPRMKVKITKKG